MNSHTYNLENFIKKTLSGKSNTVKDRDNISNSLEKWMKDCSDKISEITKSIQGNASSIVDYHIGNFMMINKLSLKDIKDNLSRRVYIDNPGGEDFWYKDDRILTISMISSIVGDRYENSFNVYAWYLSQKTIEITFKVES